ncbi:MAG: adenosylcobinamide kinase/adenosylcobinamide-phosphate guanylyltransferase [Pseudohongiellaceae bacterium]|jgi:adenosylcobinamide kinase/adenosylcobinamide-phosphate guanylyltransferase
MVLGVKGNIMKTLILGGVKSGKSRYAENLASAISASVTVIATATVMDEEMAIRIARHKEGRPASWVTIEESMHLGEVLRTIKTADVVVIDCLTLWLTNLLIHPDSNKLNEEIDAFEQAIKVINFPLILVSNETNMGVVPLGDLTRKYCDQVGLLHQRLATVCDRVQLIVAGLPLTLKSDE